MSECLTPESLRDIYIAARSEAMQRCVDMSNPVNQNECDLYGWQKVKEAVMAQCDKEWALGLLNMKPENT